MSNQIRVPLTINWRLAPALAPDENTARSCFAERKRSQLRQQRWVLATVLGSIRQLRIVRA